MFTICKTYYLTMDYGLHKNMVIHMSLHSAIYSQQNKHFHKNIHTFTPELYKVVRLPYKLGG